MDEHPHETWTRLVLGRWLHRWRLQTGATQRRVANLALMHPSFLSRVERGHRRISGARLARLIIVLDWMSGGGLDEGPWAAMRHELPPLGAPVDGPCPPTVAGIASPNRMRPQVTTDHWRHLGSAMHWDAARRTSRMDAPTLEELSARAARRDTRTYTRHRG